ncbi:MAG: transglutaminase domain-containing protein [Planctomycetota bacterium]|jgi:transglutaminase-like putative cysteine protease|nr:transglutaminase domain-containing protein [Planctomycetota bacterium]MDP6988964.1 transglutaminase domain-containing protein [Planctomycetota bacterium]
MMQALIVGLLASCVWTPVSLAQSLGARSPVTAKAHAKITLSVEIPNPVGSKYLNLWIPYPVSDAYQTIENVEVTGNFQRQGVYRETDFGNTALYLRWLQVQGNATVNFTFEVKRHERVVRDLVASEKSPSILAEPFLEVDPGVVLALADIVEAIDVGDKPIVDRAQAIYDYIVDNFERDPRIVGCGTGNVPTFLNVRKGKCADFSSTFIALARSVGVPAREVYGLRISKEAREDISDDYHCWAEFFAPEIGWVPVDPSDVVKFASKNGLALDDPQTLEKREYYFGAVDEHRVRLGTGQEILLAPVQLLGPLPYFMCPYLEVGYESNCEGADLKKMNLKGLTFTAPCHPIVERRSLIGVGEEAPVFSGQTVSGESFDVAPFIGSKYLILSFFATW